MKKQLAEALKKHLLTTPPEKIRVKDLTDECNVNRQTFYYHFEDVYDLLKWTCKYELEKAVGISDTDFDRRESTRLLIEYVDKNKALCMSLFNFGGHRQLKQLLSGSVEQLIRRAYLSAGIYSGEKKDELLEFSILFYSMAIGSILENRVLDEIKTPAETLIDYIEILIRDGIGSRLGK